MLSVESNISRFEKLIYNAATDSRQWPVFLDELKEYLGATAIILAESDFKQYEIGVYHSTGINPAFVRSYEKCFAQINPWIQPNICDVPGQVCRGEDILSSDLLIKTKFYKEWLLPQQLFHNISAVLGRERDHIFYFLALRSKKAGCFKEQDLRLLNSLMPNLRRATHRGEYLWRLAITLDVLDYMQFAVLVVDKQARLLFSNRITEELLNDEDAIQIREGKIYISGGLHAQLFYKMITRAATKIDQQGKRNMSNGFMVQRGRNKAPLWVVISPLSRRLRRVICQEHQVALVYVIFPEQVSRISETKLKTMFGLTHTEQKLARLILEGHRLFEAAQQLHVTVNTARTHMKHIYAKTNTACQTDLVRLLLTSPTP